MSLRLLLWSDRSKLLCGFDFSDDDYLGRRETKMSSSAWNSTTAKLIVSKEQLLGLRVDLSY